MDYLPQKFDSLLGTQGFSDELLKNHFTLYEGYVANTNKLMQILKQMLQEKKTGTPEYNELKRRFGWEFNGMRLHEYYFENMSKAPKILEKKSKLTERLLQDFGSYEAWEEDFKASGTMRGIGWTILYYDPRAKMLFNTWVNEHDMGHLSGCYPLAVLDVFEHAYIRDYGLKRADYIQAFMQAFQWPVAEERFSKASA